MVPAKGRWCSAAGKVTANLAGSNGSLPPGGWLIRSPAGWMPVHRDQLRAQRWVSSMGSLYLFLPKQVSFHWCFTNVTLVKEKLCYRQVTCFWSTQDSESGINSILGMAIHLNPIKVKIVGQYHRTKFNITYTRNCSFLAESKRTRMLAINVSFPRAIVTIVWRSLPDPTFSRFRKTPTCDRQTGI